DLLRRFSELQIFGTDFFQIESALIESRLLHIPAKQKSDRLLQALSRSKVLGTLYQECELLISLGQVLLDLGERERAEAYASKAVELAHNNSYNMLLARGFVLCGLTSNKPQEKWHFFWDALQLASEMGLQELIAESAYYLAVLSVESGNIVTAREYLIRSTS